MNCEDCRNLIADHVASGALPPSVEAHVAGCPACANVLEEERFVRRTLAAAPWPTSVHSGNLAALHVRAEAKETERVRHRRHLTRRWAGGLCLIAAVGTLAAWALREGGPAFDPHPAAWLASAVPLGLGVAVFAWLEQLGRRLAEARAMASMQVGVGLGRAAVGLALVAALLEPGRIAELPYTVARMAGGPAAAQVGVIEAELLCAGLGDGRLRLARASEGCRGYEAMVRLDGPLGQAANAADLGGLAVRLGTATLPAGEQNITIPLVPAMDSGDYKILITPHGADKPITVDDACHVIGMGGKFTTHFGLSLRRCWYEGIDVPHDWAASDITLDWVVIGGQ